MHKAGDILVGIVHSDQHSLQYGVHLVVPNVVDILPNIIIHGDSRI